MSEGIWEAVGFDNIRQGDTVRVSAKNGPQTIITVGKVTRLEELSPDETYWTIEDFENFYAYEFVSNEDGDASRLERFVPAFTWPTKLGAIVQGKDGGDTVHAVLVRKLATQTLWWTADWGVVGVYDLAHLVDLTVVSEGVTVEA